MTAVTTKRDRKEAVEAAVREWAPQIEAVAYNKSFTADRILSAMLTAAVKEPAIFEASRESLYLALMKCAKLGLDIGIEIDLVPLKTKNKQGQYVQVVEAWPRYTGLKAIAMRQRIVTTMTEEVVYQGDYFEMMKGLEEFLRHRPVKADDRGLILGAYTIIDRPRAPRTFHWMPIEDIEKIRAKSKSWGPKYYPAPIPWYCKKTVVRDWLNRQPKSGAMADALAADDAVTDGTAEVVDYGTGEIKQVAEPKPEPRQITNGAGIPGSEEDAGIFNRTLADDDADLLLDQELAEES